MAVMTMVSKRSRACDLRNSKMPPFNGPSIKGLAYHSLGPQKIITYFAAGFQASGPFLTMYVFRNKGLRQADMDTDEANMVELPSAKAV